MQLFVILHLRFCEGGAKPVFMRSRTEQLERYVKRSQMLQLFPKPT